MKSMKNMKIGTTKKMKILPNDKVKMLQFPVLSEDCNISHFVTTRQGGVSKGAYASFNPGEYSGDNPEAVRAKPETSFGCNQDTIRTYLRAFSGSWGGGPFDRTFFSFPSIGRTAALYAWCRCLGDGCAGSLHRCLDSRLCPCLAVCSRCEGCSCRSCRLAGNCIADCRENCSHPHG